MRVKDIAKLLDILKLLPRTDKIVEIEIKELYWPGDEY